MFFVIATQDGDSYPSVHRIFLSEKAAVDFAKEYTFNTGGLGRQTITHQYDLCPNSRMFMQDPLLLGEAEEGKDIQYYRGLTNKQYLSINEDGMTKDEIATVRPL